ncbi:PDZ domain-containing protein GIPC1 [Gryllus bimaculatus]|nr:PDZ domain-containing protein GIPC1 [Gryllus bimaculatus]
MPIFKQKGKKDSVKGDPQEQLPQVTKSPEKPSSVPTSPPKLVFHVQQAQGSPTGLISGFTNVRELYHKIAECYDFPSDEGLSKL